MPPADRATTQVSAIAIPADGLVRVSPSSKVIDLLDRADVDGERPILVTDGANVVGIVTTADLHRVAGLRLGTVNTPH